MSYIIVCENSISSWLNMSSPEEEQRIEELADPFAVMAREWWNQIKLDREAGVIRERGNLNRGWER